MKLDKRSYTTYSTACFVVWGLLFAYELLFHVHIKNHAAVYIFSGWCIGWLPAMIARKVYR